MYELTALDSTSSNPKTSFGFSVGIDSIENIALYSLGSRYWDGFDVLVLSPETYKVINPYLMNDFSHHYQLDEFTFIFRGVRSDFYFYLIFR